MKLLLIALTFAAVLWLIRGWRAGSHTARPQTREPQRGRSATTPPQTSRAPVDVVQCAFCGLHVPRHEAFGSPTREHYCCEAHRIEHLRQRAAARSG